MEKICFLCDKEYSDILKTRIEKLSHKCLLHIVKIEEHAEYEDMLRFTVKYSDPSDLLDLGGEIVISRLIKRGIL